MKYTAEELYNIIDELGITLDPDLEIEGGMDKDEIIEQQKVLVKCIKLLLVGGYLDVKKFEQAMEIAKDL